jgi:hypothetical protein
MGGDAVIAPAGGCGDIFAAEPNIAREDAVHKLVIDVQSIS